MNPNVALLSFKYFYVFSLFCFFLKMLRMSVFLDYFWNVLTIGGKHCALGGMV